MYTTVNEEGILNNYAPKTSIYYAEYPAIWEQRRYAVQGAIATLLVGLVVLTAVAVSTIG